MPAYINRLNVSRFLIVAGFLLGLRSLGYTIDHIGAANYILVPEFPYGQTHVWHHALREAAGDIATMAAILLIYFGASSYRTACSWLVSLLLMIGYYSPFWIGAPFMKELAAPNIEAEINHIIMTVPCVIGLFLSRSYFFNKS